MRTRLTEVFDWNQIAEIENYFEGFTSTSTKFYCKYPSEPEIRLKLIMENIIKNEGIFIGEDLE